MTLLQKLYKQQRFKFLLIGLLVLGIAIGLLIVPVESRYPEALIQTPFDGLWWATTTISSVGYGDYYPVSNTGKILGIILEVVGVLSFGLLVSMVTVALDETKERYYWKRVFERLESIEEKMEKLEKQSRFMVEKEVEGEE